MYNAEAGSSNALEHQDEDLDQSTDFHKLTTDLGAENDEGCSGFMHFFNPILVSVNISNITCNRCYYKY